MAVEIIPYHYRSPLLQDAVRIYVETWQRNREESLVFFRNYAQLEHFYGFVARVDAKIVGVAFGVESKTGRWWHDKVAEQIGEDHPALQGAWVLTELAVLPSHRNQQVGTLLHDHVLNKQPFPNVLLSTQVNNTGARRFYERHGWDTLHAGFPFHRGHEPYVIMHKLIDHER